MNIRELEIKLCTSLKSWIKTLGLTYKGNGRYWCSENYKVTIEKTTINGFPYFVVNRTINLREDDDRQHYDYETLLKIINLLKGEKSFDGDIFVNILNDIVGEYMKEITHLGKTTLKQTEIHFDICNFDMIIEENASECIILRFKSDEGEDVFEWNNGRFTYHDNETNLTIKDYTQHILPFLELTISVIKLTIEYEKIDDYKEKCEKFGEKESGARKLMEYMDKHDFRKRVNVDYFREAYKKNNIDLTLDVLKKEYIKRGFVVKNKETDKVKKTKKINKCKSKE